SALSAASPDVGWPKERAEVRELWTNQPSAAPSKRPMKRPINSSVIGSAELMYLLSHTRQTTLTIAVAWIESMFEEIACLLDLSLVLIGGRIAGGSVDIDKLL